MMSLIIEAGFRGFLRLEPLIRATPPTKPETVLVLAYMPALGYCVHMTPVYEALKRCGSTVLVATHGLNVEVLRSSPFVDRLIVTPDPMRDFMDAVRSLRNQLREGASPDCVLTGPADQRTRIGLLGAMACAGWRGGFAVHASLYHRPLRYDRSLSRIGNNLRLAELLGCPQVALRPRIFSSDEDVAKAALLLPDGVRALAVMAGSSGGLPTAWIEERWATVVRFAQVQLGLEVVYLGAARDRGMIERIQRLSGGMGRSLAGETSVGELAAVLSRCRMAVAIMTGSMHVARTTGVPLLVLGPAWESPLEWMTPMEPQVRLLRGEERAQTDGYRMEEISVDQVTTALAAMAGCSAFRQG